MTTPSTTRLALARAHAEAPRWRLSGESYASAFRYALRLAHTEAAAERLLADLRAARVCAPRGSPGKPEAFGSPSGNRAIPARCPAASRSRRPTPPTHQSLGCPG